MPQSWCRAILCDFAPGDRCRPTFASSRRSTCASRESALTGESVPTDKRDRAGRGQRRIGRPTLHGLFWYAGRRRARRWSGRRQPEPLPNSGRISRMMAEVESLATPAYQDRWLLSARFYPSQSLAVVMFLIGWLLHGLEWTEFFRRPCRLRRRRNTGRFAGDHDSSRWRSACSEWSSAMRSRAS